MRLGRMITADDFDAVVRFYAERLGHPPMATGASSSTVTSGPFGDTSAATADDSTTPDDKPRAVRCRMFGYSDGTYEVMIVVNRAAGEDQTHILVTWYPRQ
jgi:hypothetical protein